MKSLTQFISECKFDKDIQMYDFEIIYESLKDPKLIELAKYLKELKDSRLSFGSIFGYLGIEWDKITESDWEKYEDVEEAKDAVKRKIDHRYNMGTSIILVTDKDGKTIKYMIKDQYVIDLKNKQRVYNRDKDEFEDVESPLRISGGKNTMRIYEILDLIEPGSVTYILDSSKIGANRGKQSNRRAAKDGMVLQGDEEYYKRVAEQNIKRYKQIIAKHKAERAAKDDTLSKDVQEVLNKILELNQKLVKEPIKFADCTYAVNKLCIDTYRSAENAKSANSLLYLYSEYINNTVKNASGRNEYSYIVNDQDTITNKLKNKIKEIKEEIAKIEAKMS